MNNLTLQEQLMKLKQNMFVDVKEDCENKFNNKINEIKTNDINIHSNDIVNSENVAIQNSRIRVNDIACKRGQIFYSNLAGNLGSEQGGIRPVLIIQNDIGNKYSPTVIVAVLTSKLTKTKIPTHLEVDAEKLGLPKNSIVLFEQIRTLDKRRLREKICTLDELTMKRIDKVIDVSMKNPPEKTLLEKLPKDKMKYIINNFKMIDTYITTIETMKENNVSINAIELIEDRKFMEENGLRCYCDKNRINYDILYNDYKDIIKEREESIAL